jgi:hypothetical protein
MSKKKDKIKCKNHAKCGWYIKIEKLFGDKYKDLCYGCYKGLPPKPKRQRFNRDNWWDTDTMTKYDFRF